MTETGMPTTRDDAGPTLDRRSFLAASGSLALAFALPAGAAEAAGPLPGSLAKNPRLDAWIRIGADGGVTLLTGKVELGQGALTALAQICADELDIDIDRLTMVSGDTDLCPDEGVTAGSLSMPDSGTAVRHAAAEMRSILIGLAAERLGAPREALTVEDGVVRHEASARAVGYGALVGGADIARAATASVPPKPTAERRYVGRQTPRRDLPAKVEGREAFVHDIRPEGMLHGRVVRPPSYGATLAGLDAAAVEARPGVVAVVRDGRFLGVVAETEWQAIASATALGEAARWEERDTLPAGGPHAWLKAQDAERIATKAAPRSGRPVPARTIEATFTRPYQIHGSIGPSSAIAEFRDGRLTIDTHSQSVFGTAAAIAAMLGVPKSAVRCRHKDGSGCYGHNGADDVAADAALLARAVPGRPVRVQWSREDEHAWEPYGPAMIQTVAAAVDDKGDVLDWTFDVWSTPHSTRPGGQAGNLLAAQHLEKPFAQPKPKNGGAPNYAADRNAIPPYAFPGQTVTTHFVTGMPLRVSAHRGLGAYANVVATESFMDELAAAAGADPLDYRVRQIGDARAAEVMTRAAERFGWRAFRTAPGRGRGMAYARYKNVAAYCAVCIEVEVDAGSGAIRARRAAAAVDAGEAVNPDGLANQIEGGLIQSLSWTLKEEVRFDARRILTRDWQSYPILTFSEVPEIEVEIVDRPGEPFLGAGEASQGPTAAALANAVADAVGLRLRDLPLTPERVKAAAAG